MKTFLSVQATFAFIIIVQVIIKKIYSSTLPSHKYSNSYQISYYNQTLDHFTNDSVLQKWPHRFLFDDSLWLGAENLGPILVLTGCESDIIDLHDGNGFYNYEVIPQLGAYAIYLEHRYFGVSLPFGNDSYNIENLPYLTTEQALADYAEIIQYYKNDVLNCSDCPVITYGGSYCGELAAWMRMSYPDLVDAAMSSAAPIRYYDGVIDPEAFFISSTEVFNRTSTTGCADVIKEGFRRLTNLSPDYQEMNQYMNFCIPLTVTYDLTLLSAWFHGAFVMGSLLNNIPPIGPYAGQRKVEVACTFLANVTVNSSDEELFPRMKEAAMYCYEEDLTTCLTVPFVKGPSTPPSSIYSVTGFAGYDILTCKDIPKSVGADGVHDMYAPGPWDFTSRTSYCAKNYDLEPIFSWPLDTFGGWNVSDYSVYSNIFFTYGEYDPWTVGGVLQNISDSVVTYIVEGGCHGEDLFWPGIYDSDSLKFVRGKEIEYLEKWIQEKQARVQKVEA